MVDFSAVPLRVRLSVGSASGLILAIIAFGTVAYLTTKQAVLDGTAVRLRTSVSALPQRSAVGSRDLQRPVLEASRSPAVVVALRAGVAMPAAGAVLASLGPDTGLVAAVAIRRADGTTLMSLGAEPPGWARDTTARRDSM